MLGFGKGKTQKRYTRRKHLGGMVTLTRRGVWLEWDLTLSLKLPFMRKHTWKTRGEPR